MAADKVSNNVRSAMRYDFIDWIEQLAYACTQARDQARNRAGEDARKIMIRLHYSDYNCSGSKNTHTQDFIRNIMISKRLPMISHFLVMDARRRVPSQSRIDIVSVT